MVTKLVKALENDASWVELYELTGELVVPVLDNDNSDVFLESVRKVNFLDTFNESPLTPAIDFRERPKFSWARRHMEGHENSGRYTADPCVHRFTHGSFLLIIYLPFKVVAATRISLEVDDPEKGTLYAGQPVSACLTIHASFHWGVNKCQQYAMRFDIEELVKDWLISGHKRGDFIARVRLHTI